jgi:hypothetical protein
MGLREKTQVSASSKEILVVLSMGSSLCRSHFVSFDSINNDGMRLANLLSFEDFKRHLAAGTVPQFVMMSPNMLNDGHNTTLDYATKWAQEWLKPLLEDKAFAERTVIQLTYDESEDYDKPNHIVSLLLGNGIPKALRGTEDMAFYTHFSVLATVENNWELPTLGRFDVGSNVFQFVADVTKYTNKDPPNVGDVDNSVSYPGFLHDTNKIGYPSPNMRKNLIGAGSLPILDDIAKAWESSGRDKTPYDGTNTVHDAKNVPLYISQ